MSIFGDFFKKEVPLLGLQGSGGGLGYLAGGSGGASDKATGGTVFEDGGYTFHVFTESDTFEVLESIDIKFLVVGGGGVTSPNAYGGGAGGGGVIYPSSTQPISVGTYPVVVGQRRGGDNPTNPEPYNPNGGTTGNPSSFKGYTAGGGGNGGGFMQAGQSGAPGNTLDGRPGQGGGGGGGVAGGAFAPQPTDPQPGGPGVYNGGDGARRVPVSILASGGGGGAGGSGSNAPSSNGGRGGIGEAIPWVPPAYGTPGPNSSARYFGGGGGGVWYPGSDPKPSTQPYGGGGGDSESSPQNPFHSINNTGGGGSGQTSGASGIVIIRYAS